MAALETARIFAINAALAPARNIKLVFEARRQEARGSSPMNPMIWIVVPSVCLGTAILAWLFWRVDFPPE